MSMCNSRHPLSFLIMMAAWNSWSANYSQTMICTFYMHITLHNYHKEWIH